MRFRFGLRRPGLIGEVLLTQLVVAVAVGLAALLGFAFITQAVVEVNLKRWASNWADQLDELGAPLYVDDEAAAIVDLDRFIASYPEVIRIELYEPDGQRILTLDDGSGSEPLPPLDRALIANLESLALQRPPGVTTHEIGPTRFRLHGPIIVESLAGENLLDFDPDTAQGSATLLGYVGLDLDFSEYLSGLWPRIAVGSTLIAALILAGWAASRTMLKRALEPLAALQLPLQQLGRGNMDVELPRPRHRELVTIVTVLRETIDALKERETHLVELASRDALTGLYNRWHLMQELEEEIDLCAKPDRSSAVLFIDLDQFKYVNDTGGHAAGDALLVAAGRQILASVGVHDVVARFGGDEFIVLLRDIRRSEAREVAARLLESMRQVTQSHGERVFNLQCSVGVAIIASSRHGPEDLVTHADLACRAAKQRGRNRVEVYVISSKQDEQLAKDLHWGRQIRESLECDSFVLHFQPLQHVTTGEINHFEALLRLQTEDGLVGPAAFLPAAARFGLMSTLENWVIENAIRSLAELGPEIAGSIRLSINITGFALEEPELVSRMKAWLGHYGVPGQQLILEVTEQLAVRFATDTDRRLEQLRALGCAIAIDDFGTGYSSFNYLKRLPADYLKIDGMFVRNMAQDKIDQCMVRMTAELAREVGLLTVAEFVRSKTVMNLLARFGIDYAQGSYIGRPQAELTVPQRRSRTA